MAAAVGGPTTLAALPGTRVGAGIVCDACHATVMPPTEYWNCTDCEDFDLCTACFDAHDAAPRPPGATIATPPPALHDGTLATHLFARVAGPQSWARDHVVAAPPLPSRPLLLARTFARYASRPCLGAYPYSAPGDWLTYADVGAAVAACAATIAEHAPPHPAAPVVALYGPNSAAWVVADAAIACAGGVSVPLSAALSPRALERACDVAGVNLVLRHSAPAYAHKLDPIAAARSAPVLALDDVALAGLPHRPLPDPETSPDALATLFFSSGTTGNPKAVICTDAMFVSDSLFPFPSILVPLVHLSWRPLAHANERMMMARMLTSGAKIGIWRGSPATLLDDFQALSPIRSSCPPALFTKMYNEYKALLAVHTASNSGVSADNLAAQFSRALGSRIKFISIGGAPLARHVYSWTASTFAQAAVFESYGITEAGGITLNGKISPTVQVKLVDVPHMGYLTSDKPHPRGEIYVKTTQQSTGYYGDAAATAAAFRPDGWYATGDIGLMPSEGYLRVIDRKASCFKLGNSTWVAPEPLEAALGRSPVIAAVTVMQGASTVTDSVSAVVIVNPLALASALLAAPEALPPPLAHLTTPDALAPALATALAALDPPTGHAGLAGDDGVLALARSAVASAFVEAGVDANLPPAHIPRPAATVVTSRPYSVDDATLTPSGKPRRALIRARYMPVFNELAGVDVTAATPEAIAGVLAAALASTGRDVDPDSHLFDHAGLSSIDSISVAARISADLGVSLAVDDLYAAPTLDKLAALVAARVAGGASPAGPSESAATDWAAAKRDAVAWMGSLDEVERGAPGGSRVLVSGGTGFVGSAAIARLLARDDDTVVVSLVRAREHAAAEQRQLAVLADLWGVEPPGGRLVCVPIVSVGEPWFGLDATAYADVVGSSGGVKRVFHAAAVVSAANHAALAEANVRGTVEMLRAAIAGGASRFDYVSSMTGAGIDFGGELGGPVFEANSGYGTTKALAEWVVREWVAGAGDAAPAVAIHRCGLLGPSAATGVGNWTDRLVVLLRAVLATGLAPPSHTFSFVALPIDAAVASMVDGDVSDGPVVSSHPPLSFDAVAAAAGLAPADKPVDAWFAAVHAKLANPRLAAAFAALYARAGSSASANGGRTATGEYTVEAIDAFVRWVAGRVGNGGQSSSVA